MLPLSRTSCKRPTDKVYTDTLRTNHGELLDLFFARLLPSGTGDFGIGPSQLREKQTNPIMLLPYPLTGCFFLLLHRPRLAITAHFDGPDFNSPMYTDCKIDNKDIGSGDYLFQLADVHRLQGHGINPRPYPVLCFPFREPPIEGPLTREYTGALRTISW